MSVTALVYCLECDGPLKMRATGPGTRFAKRAVLDCLKCGAEHVVTVHVDITEPARKAACGTTGGYAAHRRKGEAPCPDCRHANAMAGSAKRLARKQAS